MPQDITSELLKFFQATNLGTYQGVACSFGAELINTLAARGYAPLPASVDKITAAQVQAYYATADQETLERNLNILKLMTLKIKMDPQDEALCVQTPIRIAQKATVLPAYNNLNDFRLLLNTFDNNTLRNLSSDIHKRLAHSQRTKTQQAIRYLQTMEEHEPTIEGLAKGFGSYFAQILSPAGEHAAQHAKDTDANPGIKLEPQDFVNYPGKHKKLLLEKIISLKGLPDVSRNGQQVNLFATFNRVARNILKQYKPGLTPVQVEQLDVKIELLLKKLAVVLHQKRGKQYASEIYTAIDGQAPAEFEFAGLFKKNNKLLDPEAIKQKTTELFDKIVAAFADGTFMSKLFGRVDVPEKVQQFIGAEFLGADVATNLHGFVQKLQANTDATEAKRKFLNRYTKVVEAYSEAERMDVAIDKLNAAGVAAGDADLQGLDNIVPLLSGFELVKQQFGKLIERTDLAVRPGKPNKYLDIRGLVHGRKQTAEDLREEMQEKQTWVNERLPLVVAKLAQLPIDLEHIDDRGQYEKIKTQLEKLRDKLVLLLAALAPAAVAVITGQELIDAKTQVEECRKMHTMIDGVLREARKPAAADAAAAQQAQILQALAAQGAEKLRRV